jgi:arginyl-tRNA--protein-N-Asp/Glu arginylyltransferase
MQSEYNLEYTIDYQLDASLAQGYYRAGQSIFSVDYIFIGGWIRVFWLRFGLQNYAFEKKHLQLMRRNQKFDVAILPMHITSEHEELYALYRKSIDFEASNTVSQFLFGVDSVGTVQNNVFNSKMIELRLAGRLVAVGVFDLGTDSCAGIVNFYDPEFQKYSLGKYLILKKIEYAQNAGMDWYYPGYIGYQFPKFDYKLFPGTASAEIFDPISREWISYSAEILEELASLQHVFFQEIQAEEE